MFNETTSAYGFSTGLFATRKVKGDSLIVGGIAADQSRWVRILSYRAAQLLWFQLTQMLYPEKEMAVTTSMTTAPMRNAGLPTITTHVTVEELLNGGYGITGWVGSKTWQADLTQGETEQFLVALDHALYPYELNNRQIQH